MNNDVNNNNQQFFSTGFLSTKKAIAEWLDKYKIKNYTINDDLSVDVKGNVDISSENLEIIPIRFGSVTGNFWCNNNRLISLVGSPKSVGGSFSCNNNKLTNLLGSPKSITKNFFCDHNKLLNLIGSPEIVGGGFNCSGNQLTNLVGSPKAVGDGFWCNNNKLTSLIGSPETVGGEFTCNNNQLTSLEGSPKTVNGNFVGDNNKIASLSGSPKIINGSFYCRNNKIISLFDLRGCSFNEKIYFNIDENTFKQEKFKQEELIQTLRQYYDELNECYVLTREQFYNTITPTLGLEKLKISLKIK